MPINPLLSKDDLMNVLWERSDESIEQVRNELLAAEVLLRRTRNALGFLLYAHHVDPDHIPPVRLILDELDDELSRPLMNGEGPLRRLILAPPPKGELISLPVRKRRTS